MDTKTSLISLSLILCETTVCQGDFNSEKIVPTNLGDFTTNNDMLEDFLIKCLLCKGDSRNLEPGVYKGMRRT